MLLAKLVAIAGACVLQNIRILLLFEMLKSLPTPKSISRNYKYLAVRRTYNRKVWQMFVFYVPDVKISTEARKIIFKQDFVARSKAKIYL